MYLITGKLSEFSLAKHTCIANTLIRKEKLPAITAHSVYTILTWLHASLLSITIWFKP